MKIFNSIIKATILSLFILLLLPSCTITKMRYSSGFNVSFNLRGNTQDGERKTMSQKRDKRLLKTEKSDTFSSLTLLGSKCADSTTQIIDIFENYSKESESCFLKQRISSSNSNISKIKQDIVSETKTVPGLKSSKANNSGQGKKNNKPNKTHAGNSWIIALLLCIFFGVIGAHRFYLGYTGIGIIQLLTFGLLGIWTLIDFIRILTGSLKPKDGDYYDY